MHRTLFNIGEDLTALYELLTETDGEITNEDAEAAIDDFFAELGAERDRKLDGYCALIAEFEATAAAREQEAKRLLALAATGNGDAKRLKNRLKYFLETHGETKIETTRYKIALQANGGKMPVELDEAMQAHPEELPEGLRRVRFEPDLDAIRASLESGEDLEFAKFGTRGTHLRIR